MKDLDAVEDFVELGLRDVQPDAPHHPQHARLKGGLVFQQHLLTASFAESFASGWRFGVGPHSVVCKSIQFRISQNTGTVNAVGTSGGSCGYGNGDDEPDAPHHPQHTRLRRGLVFKAQRSLNHSTLGSRLRGRISHACPRTAFKRHLSNHTE